jgi:hypothetical protein
VSGVANREFVGHGSEMGSPTHLGLPSLDSRGGTQGCESGVGDSRAQVESRLKLGVNRERAGVEGESGVGGSRERVGVEHELGVGGSWGRVRSGRELG